MYPWKSFNTVLYIINRSISNNGERYNENLGYQTSNAIINFSEIVQAKSPID